MPEDPKLIKNKVKEEIDELTAQAMHTRTGWDLDACRTDALMKQANWEPLDSINGIIMYLEKQKGPDHVKFEVVKDGEPETAGH